MFTVKTLPDYSFTCPSLWTDGAVENLSCVIPRAKFSAKSSGGLCDIYSDTVVFTLIKADGTYSTCTVTKFDTTCNAAINTQGCGCREISGGNIVIDYSITANSGEHKGGNVECQPQCLDAGGLPTILLSPNTSECSEIKFGK